MDDGTKLLLWERFLPFVDAALYRGTEGMEGDIPRGIAEDVFSAILHDHPERWDYTDEELLNYARVGLKRYVNEPEKG